MGAGRPANPGLGHNQPPEDLDDDDDIDDAIQRAIGRDADLLGRVNSPIRDELDKLYDEIVRGFQDQATRSDDLDSWWNCWNCELDDGQFYNGNSEIYVPLIHDAIEARATRFANQLFPPSGRLVECVSSDGSQPSEIIALVEHYIRRLKLKTQIVKPMFRTGDIEGSYHILVDWEDVRRQIVSRETHGPTVEHDGMDVDVGGEEIVDVVEEDIEEGGPTFEVLHDSDVLILPVTADNAEQALQMGGSVTIVRRVTKSKAKAMAAEGLLDKKKIDDLVELGSEGKPLDGLKNEAKNLVKAIGIRAKGTPVILLQTWKMLPLKQTVSEKGVSYRYDKDGEKRLCRMWFGINREQLGCKRNPFWNDRLPLLSCPVEKVPGSVKGKSQVERVAPIQYGANDAANEMEDVDHFAAMPIVMRKPGSGNGPLVLNLAAVWDVDPNEVKFAEFPDLSTRGMARILRAREAIFQTLGVNPSMVPTRSPGSKANQAQIAQEQQVDLLTTSESVSVAEEGILTPMVEWMVDLDHQFRKKEITIRAFGEMGVRAEMISVEPLQNRTRYAFSWAGANQARNAQMFQQQIAFINVARGMIQDLKAQGYQLNPAPALEQAAQGIFGAKTAPLILTDQRRLLSMDVAEERTLLADGHDVMVSPFDNHPEHIKAHLELAKESGDPHGNIRAHVQRHMTAMQLQLQTMMRSQVQGAQGVPGGGQQPGVAGTPRGGMPPRMGAQPRGPQQQMNPPGAVHPDQVPRAGGVVPMPRRM